MLLCILFVARTPSPPHKNKLNAQHIPHRRINSFRQRCVGTGDEAIGDQSAGDDARDARLEGVEQGAVGEAVECGFAGVGCVDRWGWGRGRGGSGAMCSGCVGESEIEGGTGDVEGCK